MTSDVTFSSLTFNYCFAVNNGGCIYLGGSNTLALTTTFNVLTVVKSETYIGRGSIIYTENPY